MKSVLIVSHGSRLPQTLLEVQSLVKNLKAKTHIPIIEYAFLELESPSIPQGIDLCVEKGAAEIVVLLNFLNSGRHVDEDIPNIIQEAKVKHPEIKISITKPVGQHEKITEVFLDMISE